MEKGIYVAIEGDIHSGDDPYNFAVSGFGGYLALVRV